MLKNADQYHNFFNYKIEQKLIFLNFIMVILR